MGILYFIVQFIITTSIFVFTYVEVKENYKTSKKKKKLGFVLITISFLAFGATIIDFFIKNLQERWNPGWKFTGTGIDKSNSRAVWNTIK